VQQNCGKCFTSPTAHATVRHRSSTVLFPNHWVQDHAVVQHHSEVPCRLTPSFLKELPSLKRWMMCKAALMVRSVHVSSCQHSVHAIRQLSRRQPLSTDPDVQGAHSANSVLDL
jgi:hypothetical protein